MLMALSKFPLGVLETLALTMILIAPQSETLGFQTPFTPANHTDNRMVVLQAFSGDTNGILQALDSLPQEVVENPGRVNSAALNFVRATRSSSPSLFIPKDLAKRSSLTHAMILWVDRVMQLHVDAPFTDANN